MKHKSLFRLLVKFLGVWLFCNGTVGGVSAFTNFVLYTWFRPSNTTISYPYWPYLMSHAFGMMLGLYLFFGGKWIVDLAIPSNRPYCHECGYDLTGATSNRCNECGTPFRAAEEVNATR